MSLTHERAKLLGSMGGRARKAKYSRDEIRVITEPARKAAEAKRIAAAIAEWNLDPTAEDYQARLDAAMSLQMSRIRLRRT